MNLSDASTDVRIADVNCVLPIDTVVKPRPDLAPVLPSFEVVELVTPSPTYAVGDTLSLPGTTQVEPC